MLCPSCKENVGKNDHFCGHCGEPLRASDTQGPGGETETRLGVAGALQQPNSSEGKEGQTGESDRSAPRDASIELATNCNRPFIETATGTLQYRVTNSGGQVLEDVEIMARVSTAGICVADRIDQLGAGETETMYLGFNVGDLCGFAAVTVEVRLRGEDGLHILRGQHEIKVFARPTANTQFNLGGLGSTTVNIKDVSGVVDASDMTVVGPDLAAAVRAAYEAGPIADVNQLLTRIGELPTAYAGVHLRPAVNRKGRKTVSRQFSRPAGSVPWLSLFIGSGSAQRRVHIFTGHEVRFGRDRKNTLVLRCLPRSDTNDQLSMKISGTHGAFQWRGALCTIEDRRSENGTQVDGECIGRNTGVPLRSGQTISIGKAIDLRATACRTPAGFEAAAYASIPDLGWAQDSGEPPGSMRLDRVGNLCQESYLLLHDAAVIGSCPDAAIFAVGLAPVHACLLAGRDTVWIEPVAEEGILLEGTRLHPGELACLLPGMTLGLGAVSVEVAERRQLGL